MVFFINLKQILKLQILSSKLVPRIKEHLILNLKCFHRLSINWKMEKLFDRWPRMPDSGSCIHAYVCICVWMYNSIAKRRIMCVYWC